MKKILLAIAAASGPGAVLLYLGFGQGYNTRMSLQTVNQLNVGYYYYPKAAWFLGIAMVIVALVATFAWFSYKRRVAA